MNREYRALKEGFGTSAGTWPNRFFPENFPVFKKDFSMQARIDVKSPGFMYVLTLIVSMNPEKDLV